MDRQHTHRIVNEEAGSLEKGDSCEKSKEKVESDIEYGFGVCAHLRSGRLQKEK